MQPYSLYLHIPFCRHRCGYCDFNTYAGLESQIPAYVAALHEELWWVSSAAGERLPVHTVFFGGGTPSLLPAADLASLLSTLRESFDVWEAAEITLEANPEGLTRAYLRELFAMGFNRLSLGMQSARPDELRLLERTHDPLTVIEAVKAARQAGFANLNLDLIFGLPHQTLKDWRLSLMSALDLEPEHLSLYALTLEHGTPLAHYVERGLLPLPDPDLAAEMYEWSGERLDSRGYHQYEISNWARFDGGGELLSCRHNLQYWRNLAYLGFGAGAHGYAGGVRTVNIYAPQAFIRRLIREEPPTDSGEFPASPAAVETIRVDRRTEMSETLFMGLRLTREGVSVAGFQERFGCSLQEQFGEEIRELVDLGLLEVSKEGGESLRLTARGRLLGNQVFMRFV
jgi:oxygen-independent coproporphyrinogen-3 oxidase